MTPTFLPSRYIPFTSNSHITPFFSRTAKGPQQAQRIVSTSALSLLRAISHLPFLKCFLDHSEDEGADELMCWSSVPGQSRPQAARPGGSAVVGMAHRGQGEDGDGPPLPQQGEWTTPLQAGGVPGIVARAPGNLTVLLSVARYRFKVSFCTFGKECPPTCCLCWAPPR